MSCLQLSKDLLGTRDSDLTRVALILSIGNLAIIKDHSPATIPIAHTSSPAIVLGEESLGVAEEQDIVALDAIDLAPCIHDPGVVRRDHGNDVDALALQLRQLLDVGGQVVGLAAGGEGAGDGNEDDLFARPFFRGIVLLGTAAGGGVGICDGSPPGGVSMALRGNDRSALLLLCN
jgi:hypothetical protein